MIILIYSQLTVACATAAASQAIENQLDLNALSWKLEKG